MSLASSVKFFYPGRLGFILVIAGGIIGAGAVIKQGYDKRAEEAEKHQVTRPLGVVQPTESVDPSTASKESVLSSRRINPGFHTQPEDIAIKNVQTASIGRQAALPTLVSFYSQVQATPTPVPTPTQEERPKVQEIWLPPSIFIPCTLVNTIESSHINTPVVGEVIRDVFQNGHLIIPAGTLVSSFAQSGAVRDRIEVAGSWLLVFTDGRQLKVSGIACVRQADPSNQQFGMEDGSAGLQGELVESDHWANAKAFLSLLMTSTNQIVTSAASGVISRGYGGGVGLPDTSQIQAKYLDQLFNGETGDGRFVRVSASTEFYIFPTETVLPNHRSIVNAASDKRDESTAVNSSDPIQVEKEMLRQAQPQAAPADSSKFKY